MSSAIAVSAINPPYPTCSEDYLLVESVDRSKDGKMIIETTYKECFAESSGYRITKDRSVTGIITSKIGNADVVEVRGKMEKTYVKERNARPLPRISPDGLVEIAKNKKVLVFGEIHNVSEDDDLFFLMLPKLKEIGFTALGIEGPTDSQEIAQNVYDDPSLENLKKYNAVKYNKDPGSAVVYTPDALPIIKAKKSGLGIFLYDLPAAHEDHSNPQIVYSKEREEYSGSMIENQVKNGSRMVVFCGAAHAQLSPNYYNKKSNHKAIKAPKTLAQILKEKLGPENVLSVDTTGCRHSFIDYCIEK